MRERTATSRASETVQQHQTRLQQQRLNKNRARAHLWREKQNAAFAYNPNLDYKNDPACLIQSMNLRCQHCSALKWKNEAPGMCCSGGKVQIPLLTDPPHVLQNLYNGDSEDSAHFLRCIRRYNSCFQMTSFGTTKEIKEPGYMPTFKIQGQVYHRIGSLLQSLPNEQPKFLQIYFIGDDSEQARQRCQNVPQTRQNLVRIMQDILNRENAYVKSFKMAMEKISPDVNLIIFADKTPVGHHERKFNAPMTSEVAVIMAGQEHGTRDIVLELRNNTIKKIADTNRSYDALQYPILFWKGEDGYHFEMYQSNPHNGMLSRKKISAMDFYSFRIMVRSESFNILLRARDLFHQFIVDMYAKIESERLRYIRLHQRTLRVEQYAHLRDAINNDGNVNNIGQLIILPSTFTGGPRYMHERIQDAMAYVRNYGRPDLFITFTCNPAWDEIKNELFPGQKPQHRHDLLARVFHLKQKILMNLITKGKIFGDVQCHMYTIEWQKRGLPHAHILVWLKQKIHSDRVDQFISAEIPNLEEDPQLYACITTQMVHGPCGNINPHSPCMKDGKCTKRYPRAFLTDTQTGHDGYPLYRRRSPEDGGLTANIVVRRAEVVVDNRWIVPYCPLLSKIFHAHINIEFCNSVKSIKYICKYVNKGSDMAVFGLTTPENDRNEVLQYEMGRYISSNEAVWRILNFPIHERFPTVTHLSVHLENGQRVYFTSSNVMEHAQFPQETTLTAFFKLCVEDDFAQTLLYHEVPKYYTWNTGNKKWNRRRLGLDVPQHPGIKSSDALGRVYTVHPNNSECFHLRLLLHEVRGPKSFEDLRTFQGNISPTFKQACQLRGLLENDEHWNATLQEAALTHSPTMLRNLFAVMLQTCAVSNPRELWNIHREDLSEDILHQAKVRLNNMQLQYTEAIFNSALIIIEDKVISLGGSHLTNFGLPESIRNPDSMLPSELIAERSYDTDALIKFLEENENKLVPDQKEVFDKITTAVFNNAGGVFFLDAPGGTGKTFVINLILAKVRQRNCIALAVASSGIAATLLTGGRTAHSAFKLPLNMANSEVPTCNISRGSGKAKVLQECKLIVWDECTMSHKAALEALDVTLQDLRNNNRRMGGITLLLAGDFRQTLPVIPRGTRADEMHACLKSSVIWNEIETLNLQTNMRVHTTGDADAQQFSDTLLQLGNGNLISHGDDGFIAVEDIGKLIEHHEDLLQEVFPNLSQHFKDHSWLRERAILAPKNDNVILINKQLLGHLPGTLHIYKSVDTVCATDDTVHYPTEFLNSLRPSGVPPHILELKIGAPIMLLRNFDPPSLCNGTRLCIKRLTKNIIEATIISGQAAGEDVFIPRIPIIPSDMPFQFRRLQFPVQLSFAMTINKAQGQSLKVVGLDLQYPCFSHGQLYVGCSRVGIQQNLSIYAPNGRTLNIVYPEVLR
jgi:hypothetical protein